MNICLAFSPDWVKYIEIQMYAIFKNNNNVKIYLMSENLTKDNLGMFDLICKNFDNCTYEYINMSKIYPKYIKTDINVDTRFTKYTLYRLILPELINEDKILYIDSDTIVNNNLLELYNIQMRQNLIAGVEDIGLQKSHKSNIGLSKNSKYINAGICLMNLKKIKQLKLYKKWIKMCNETFYNAHDQDILNITCQGKIKYVDNKYNVSLSTGLLIKIKNIIIAHYAGDKPWKYNNCNNYILWAKYEYLYKKEILKLNPDIPKIIHYAWFGGNKKPDLVNDCILSWKEHLKAYSIIEWNENNFDIESVEYIKNAYADKKYAFINDYLRLWCLHEFGGLYLDADVKVLKNFDEFLKHECFTGHETKELLITATMGSKPKTKWIDMLLNYYNNLTYSANGIESANTFTISKITKPYIIKQENGYTYLDDNTIIYPIETFCSYDHTNLKPIPTKNSYSVHLFMGSWIGRTKLEPKTNLIESKNFNIDEILIDKCNWQMGIEERASACYLIDKLPIKKVAIEIGSFEGGFLNILSEKFDKTYSCDMNHDRIDKTKYNNVEWLLGDSKETIPLLIKKINNSDEEVSFILIDGDHSYNGAKIDLQNVLNIKPKNDMFILLHDSWYPPVREAICSTNFNNNNYVKYINTDYCSASSIVKKTMFGGFCLIILSTEIRNLNINIVQSNDRLFLAMYKYFKGI